MRARTTLLLAGLLLALPLAAGADEPPARNPDWAHALPDLRTARWLLTQQADNQAVRTHDEQEAIRDIDVSIGAILMGAFNDHKDDTDHEQIEMAKDPIGRLRQALDLLHRAHAYLSKEIDDPMGVSVRNRSLEHIDRAVLAIGHALEST